MNRGLLVPSDRPLISPKLCLIKYMTSSKYLKRSMIEIKKKGGRDNLMTSSHGDQRIILKSVNIDVIDSENFVRVKILALTQAT